MDLSNPRRHHYCPAGYLANFAVPSERNGRLIAVNVKTGEERNSTPNNEGHQRDFYKIEVSSHSQDPYALERDFGVIESQAIAAIRGIINSQELPKGSDFDALLSFVGLLYARVPSTRNKWDDFERSFYSLIMKITVSSEKIFDSVLAKARQDGNPDISYEEMKDFVDNKKYKIDISQNSSLKRMLDTASIATDTLLQRNWSLAIAPSNTEFIASDNPVGLRWIKPIRGPYSPGFGLRNTEVSLPLSPTVALIGAFEKIPKVHVLNAFEVASVNEWVHLRADRWLYARTGNPKTVGKAGDVISFVERLRDP